LDDIKGGGVDVHGDNGALLEVDAEPRRPLELVEEELEPRRSPIVRSQDDQSIIRVLEHRTGDAVDEGMKEHIVSPDRALENISCEEEQVRREGVPLAEPCSVITYNKLEEQQHYYSVKFETVTISRSDGIQWRIVC
jgi:hypothetical protein